MSLSTKIAFFILFLVILAEPHVITGHVLSVPEAYAESAASLLVFGAAYGVYLVHRREVRRREARLRALEQEAQVSHEKLVDAFAYIGVVNRRLPLLQKLTSGLLAGEKGNHHARKDVFARLLAVAVTSVAKADWGMFRFIDRTSGQTLKEFTHAARHFVLLKTNVSNKDLIASWAQQRNIRIIGELCVIPTTDQEMPTQGYLVFPKTADARLGDEASVLQAIVDQAQLLYKYLYS